MAGKGHDQKSHFQHGWKGVVVRKLNKASLEMVKKSQYQVSTNAQNGTKFWQKK
jgi:hypothetical protein